MRALTWQGNSDVRVEDVPDPTIQQPTDAIVRVTSTAICGSDLHLYSVLGAFLHPGDVLGHEFMGIVEEVGPEAAGHLSVGDRVVVPFNISCGHCWMCSRGLFAQCETTQNTKQGKGASLFGYTDLYGAVPGGQAEYVRVPQAQFGPVKVPHEGADERYLYLSDILPTAWQGVKYANVPDGGTLAVMGLGPVGQLAVRSALKLGEASRVIGVDLVPERLETAKAWGAEVLDLRDVDGGGRDPQKVGEAIREMTGGRGADSVLEAVGMEAHGNPVAHKAISAVAHLPGPLGRPAIEKAGIDRLAALHSSIEAVRRGGTVSVSGVYGGMVDPMPMMTMFDKGIAMRMGQCHVKQWTQELFDVANRSEDLLGLEQLATHRVSLEEAPAMYEVFQKKQDNCLKVVLKP
ncbi:glutathione-dependent formaldehyde dehydrogenase [Kytococcus sedentarius]|uniref:Theronine dehydrogenase-like Zn-dependent dehydrogenase n=1 Tax=Kytococcus sedentarius (strain ATCC 14392 / DSM 20547 / JCM 11482 / CCUG 33030 / NBRC 15357 / NCTC 11040 / CCM 314 / 541) TaxID=478801 RepID=C7NIG0_KYTSD|nr:zinc-dependent alcohol dehydrogenase [Kytococcus sedentarius]ACV05131.1 theronine dehydrogenase-like Zn-dependent dehydrogenase [Kytococcus sedentarius DSM 20547]QQB63604.1 glutathione-dependent formaldehyde dehydrogenase [Kytococcus sedentarius]STX13465.1 Formaldehyde dismutase [Kytococcus sedentarius]